MASLGIVTGVILSGIVILNYFAFRLYKSTFFKYILLAWFSNMIYIMFEAWFPILQLNIFINTDYIIYFLSLISTYFFYLALKQTKSRKRGFDFFLFVWIVLIICSYLFSELVFSSDFAYKFHVIIFSGLLFTSIILIKLAKFMYFKSPDGLLKLLRVSLEPIEEIIKEEGEAIKEYSEIDPVILKDHVNDLLNTSKAFYTFSFGSYGIIQIFYLLKPQYGNELFFTILFYFALILKIINGVALLYLLLADTRYAEIAIRVRSTFNEVSVMLENIQHGITGPISNINKDLVLLKTKVQNDGYSVNKVADIKKNISAIQDHANSVLAMKETKEFYVKQSKVWNIVYLLKEAVDTVKNKFEEKALRITLKSSETNINISGYKERLIEAFTNIITNGVEACLRKPGSSNQATVEVVCYPSKKKNKTIVKIKDFGEGIPSDLFTKITKARFSTKDPSEKSNIGLGLFIAKRFIKRHDGNIKFDSDGESFTEVIIELPLYKGK